MGLVPAGDHRLNAATAQSPPVGIRIVGSVGVHSLWSTPEMSGLTTDRRHRIDQRLQLLDVVLVGSGVSGSQRSTSTIDDDVVLAASFPPVNRARSGLLSSPESTERAPINRCTRPVDLVRPVQLSQQPLMEHLLDSGFRPVSEPTPASHPRTATHLLRQILPRDPGLEDQENTDQRFTILHGLAAGVTKPSRLGFGQQRLDLLPESFG